MDLFIVTITETTGWDAGEYEIIDTFLIVSEGELADIKLGTNERMDVEPATLLHNVRNGRPFTKPVEVDIS